MLAVRLRSRGHGRSDRRDGRRTPRRRRRRPFGARRSHSRPPSTMAGCGDEVRGPSLLDPRRRGRTERPARRRPRRTGSGGCRYGLRSVPADQSPIPGVSGGVAGWAGRTGDLPRVDRRGRADPRLAHRAPGSVRGMHRGWWAVGEAVDDPAWVDPPGSIRSTPSGSNCTSTCSPASAVPASTSADHRSQDAVGSARWPQDQSGSSP